MLRQRAAATFLGLTGALALGLAFGIASQRAAPDAVLASTYGTAFADSDTSWTSLPSNIWLSGLGSGSLTGANRVVSPGDTITISSSDGHPQVIKVTAREMIDGERFGMPGVRFHLVTGRSDRDLPGAVVRFMLAVETPVGLHAQPSADRLL
jgi:hypothetical protein